jgi:WD40 repeat protein
MKTASRSRKKARLVLLFVAVLIVGILLYFQLLYKSERVDEGIVNLERMIAHHHDVVTAVRFNSNDSLIISSSVDKTIRISERISGKILRSIHQHEGITYFDISRSGEHIVTASYDGKIRLWRIFDGLLLKEFPGHRGTVWTVAFSADGETVASSGEDKLIKLWNVETGRLIRELKGHSLNVWSVKFNHDGTKLATCSFDRSFKIWNVIDGRLLMDNISHKQAVVDIAFSHDGTILASVSDDKTIRLWRTHDGSLIRMMEVPEHVQAAEFSPNNKFLLTGGRDKPAIGELLQNLFGDSKINKGVSARLWNVSGGTLLHTFTAHANDVNDVAFSHNGEWIATASADKTVGLWRVYLKP